MSSTIIRACGDRRCRPVGHHDLQRPRRHAAAGQPGLRRHRRAAQAAPRPHSQPGRDGEGLRRARARHARRGGEGAQRRDDGAEGRRSRRPPRTCSAGALRQLFALSEAYPDLKANANFQQLQARAFATSRTRSPRRGASSTTRCRNTIPASSSFPAALFAGVVRLHAEGILRSRRGPQDARAGAAGEVLRSLQRAFRPRAREPSVMIRALSAVSTGIPDPLRAPGMTHWRWPPTGSIRHIQSNKRRSVALLIGLFFLVYLMVYAGALVAEALSTSTPARRADAARVTRSALCRAMGDRRHGALDRHRLPLPPDA